MNQRRYGLSSLLLWTALLVLPGCGGGNNASGISQDTYGLLRADYEQAVAERDAAQAVRMTAEASAVAAKEVQVQAEADARAAIQARKAAETRRDAAVVAQAVAEAGRAAGETAKLDAQADERTAIEAQVTAEDEVAVAKRNKVAAEAALAAAEFAAVDARRAQARAEAAQVDAEAAQTEGERAQEMAEAAARAAVEAQNKAEEDLKAALTELRAAEAAQETAEAARMMAEKDLNAVLAAAVKAEEGLEKTRMERDEALGALAAQREAEAAQRARVDARAIRASAGFTTIVTPGVDLDGDGQYDPEGVAGEVVPVRGSSTHTVANYQGAQRRLFNLPAESLRIRASRFGFTVSVSASVSGGGDTKQLFRGSSIAGPGNRTSVTERARVPGGHTQHLFAVTDIEAPVTVPAGPFDPAGFTRTLFDQDYLVYGAWLMRPDSTGGTAYAAGFATGSDLFDPVAGAGNGIAELVGKATYRGSAAGFFAEQYVNVDTAVSGTFTAAAELSADFGRGTVDNGVAGGIISGTVTDFLRDDGVPVNWLVNLDVLDLGAIAVAGRAGVDGIAGATNTAAMSIAAGGFTAGTTSGSASGVPWTGEWGVQFAGDDAAFAAKHPTGVVGTFGAQYGSPVRLRDEPASLARKVDLAFVTVIGGFGARKQ